MTGGGRATLHKVIQFHVDLEQSNRRSGELQGTPLLLVGLIALTAAFFDISNKPVIIGFGVLFLCYPWIVRWYTQRTNRRMEAGLDELKGYIHNVVFEYEIWLDMMSDEASAEVRLGMVELGRKQVSFEHRLKDLFENYPKLAEKKSLEPFPRWYRAMHTGHSQRSQDQYVNGYWKYALALVLNDEFFGQATGTYSSSAGT